MSAILAAAAAHHNGHPRAMHVPADVTCACAHFTYIRASVPQRSAAQMVVHRDTALHAVTSWLAHDGCFVKGLTRPCILCKPPRPAQCRSPLLSRLQDSTEATAEQLQELDLELDTVVSSEAVRDTLRSERMFALQVRLP